MANTNAYGFIGLTDLYAQRVATVGVGRVYEAVQVSAADYSRVVNSVVSELVEPVTGALEQIELPGDGTLQPLDEWATRCLCSLLAAIR